MRYSCILIVMSKRTSRFQNPYFSQKDRQPASWLSHWFWHGDGWAYAGIFLILIGGVLFLGVRGHWLWIDFITITGYEYLQPEDIAQPVRTVLQKRRWLILPQRLYPITDMQRITNELNAALTSQVSLESLVVAKDFPNTIVVTLKERVPGFVYMRNNVNYYLDRNGVISKEQIPTPELEPQFPRIRDWNEMRTEQLEDQVVFNQVINFITDLNEQFTPTTGLNISEYALPEVRCTKKEYVAENIFADEIADTEDAEIRDQKSAILERLQNNEITVDQSLDLLEEVKRSEMSAGETTPSGQEAFIQIEPQYVDANCNYVAVVRDVDVVTQEGFAVRFDSELPLDIQLENLNNVLEYAIDDPARLQYIDVRFVDRVFYR